MAQESAITDEIRNMIGVELEPFTFEVEKGAIIKLAQSVEDPNPLWQDEKYARNHRYGGIIASPTFYGGIRSLSALERIINLPCPLTRMLNGGNELEFFVPLRPGDVVTARMKLAEVNERDTKTGKMLFKIIETTYTNQLGEVTCKGRQTMIRY